MPPVALGDGERLEQARHPVVGDGAAIAAGLVAERAGDPAFSEAGRAGDEQVFVAADPASIDQVPHDRAVDPARGAQIEILDAGSLAEGGELEPGSQAPGIALGGFPVDQQAEPVLEAQGFEGGVGTALFVQGLGHAGEAEGDEPLGCRVGQQDLAPFNGSSLGRGCWGAAGAGPRGRLR